MTTAAIVQFQKKQEAKFVCSACGADRACDCNAPAIERLATIRELRRQQKQRERQKRKENKDRVVATEINKPKAGGWSEKALDQALPTEEEADESYQETLFDQACLLLDSMAGSTRQRFFAYLKGKYRGYET